MDFWLGHFIPNFTHNGILSKPHFKDGEDIRDTFIRRFARLLDFFIIEKTH
jgi:hypothetical protein